MDLGIDFLNNKELIKSAIAKLNLRILEQAIRFLGLFSLKKDLVFLNLFHYQSFLNPLKRVGKEEIRDEHARPYHLQ